MRTAQALLTRPARRGCTPSNLSDPLLPRARNLSAACAPLRRRAAALPLASTNPLRARRAHLVRMPSYLSMNHFCVSAFVHLCWKPILRCLARRLATRPPPARLMTTKKSMP